MNRDTLRDAVERLGRARVAEFDRELGEAFAGATQTASITSMRLVREKWATVVAIERHPDRSRAMREERVTGDPYATEDEFRAAQRTIARILAEASAEAGIAPGTHPARGSKTPAAEPDILNKSSPCM